MNSRREDSFVNLPGFAAKFYDKMMQARATKLQYREIAQDLVSKIDGGRLLDVGAGPGRLLLEIHRLNPDLELFGLDISVAMVEQARRNLAGIETDFRQGNIRVTDYESDFFDLVTCSGSFYLWDKPEESLEEVHRILKKGRSAYLFESHKDFDGVELREAIKANLKGENFFLRLLMPYLLIKQLKMTYQEDEIKGIVEHTSFAESYTIERMTVAGLPIWLRIGLEKCA